MITTEPVIVSTQKELVKLTVDEYTLAAYAGFWRQVENTRRGNHNAHGFRGVGYDAHILGAIGEYVVAKSLGLFWSGIEAIKAPDVGPLHVRTASSNEYLPSLIVRPADPSNAIFVLITGNNFEYEVCGWIWGVDAKLPVYRRDPQGRPAAFFVPQSSLRPIAELKGMLR